MKAPDDKISYAIICDKFPIPQTRYATYDLAVKWAKLDQPNHRPFYIVKCTEHFEICNRQSAIDAAIEATDDWSGKIKYDRSGWNKAIKDLPPAQLGTMAVKGYPIDADYLMAKVAEEYGERARDALYRIIRYMPSAQPERPKGHWIDTGSEQECSECGEIQCGYDNFRYYCAKCGSDNRGK